MLPNDPDSALQVESGDVIVVPQGETRLLGSSTTCHLNSWHRYWRIKWPQFRVKS